MGVYTKNYKLKKPHLEDYYSISDTNYNMDVIDTVLQELENRDTGTSEAYDDSELQERVSSLESDREDVATKEFVAEEIGKIEIVGGTGGQGESGADGVDGADGKDGADGLSAYEIAVNNGFSGSESDWLLSLKGADGVSGDGSGSVEAYDDSELQERVSSLESDWEDVATKEFVAEEIGRIEITGGGGVDGADGVDGQDGADGQDGLSAYEIAVNNGFSGSESDWLLSLKGADGVSGDGSGSVEAYDDSELQERVSGIESNLEGFATKDYVDTAIEKIEIVGGSGSVGADGQDGADGADGKDGADGADGQDGLSAYGIAVNNGFSGSESDWLLSLKGADGVSGDGSGSVEAYDDSELQERVGAIESDYVTATAVAEVLQEAMDTKADKTTLGDYVKTIEFVDAQATQDETITANQEKIADVESSLSNYVKTTAFTTGQATQDEAITANQLEIEKTQSSVSAVASRVTENEVDIVGLKNVVDFIQPSDLLTAYDKIITTQEQFEELYQSADWLGATRVAFFGARFIRNDGGGLVIPQTVKQIDCLGGAVIVIDDWVYTEDVQFVFGYASEPDDDVSANICAEIYNKTTGASHVPIFYQMKNIVVRNAIVSQSQNATLNTSFHYRLFYFCKNVIAISPTMSPHFYNVASTYSYCVHTCDTVRIYDLHLIVNGTNNITTNNVTIAGNSYNIERITARVTLNVAKAFIGLLFSCHMVSNVFLSTLTNNSDGTLSTYISAGTNTFIDTDTLSTTFVGGITYV